MTWLVWMESVLCDVDGSVMLFLVLELDEFGGGVVGGGYPNEELTDS